MPQDISDIILKTKKIHLNEKEEKAKAMNNQMLVYLDGLQDLILRLMKYIRRIVITDNSIPYQHMKIAISVNEQLKELERLLSKQYDEILLKRTEEAQQSSLCHSDDDQVEECCLTHSDDELQFELESPPVRQPLNKCPPDHNALLNELEQARLDGSLKIVIGEWPPTELLNEEQYAEIKDNLSKTQ